MNKERQSGKVVVVAKDAIRFEKFQTYKKLDNILNDDPTVVKDYMVEKHIQKDKDLGILLQGGLPFRREIYEKVICSLRTMYRIFHAWAGEGCWGLYYGYSGKI